MKNILAISFLSLLATGCSTNTIISQSDLKKPTIDNLQCSNSSIKKVSLPLTNGKEIPSDRKYCYVWQLEKQDRTVVLAKTGISQDTKYISWPENTVVVINNGNQKDNQSISGLDLYKFINEKNFSITSEKIKVKTSFYLEQNKDDIYISLINKYFFKDTHIVYKSKDFQVFKDTEMDLANRVKLKLGETVVMQVPSPYINDTNKFYYLKFTINAFD